jgi:multiple sugar transport system substrate-binding protein
LILVFVGLALILAGARAAPVTAVTVWLPGMAVYREAVVRDFQADYPEIRLNLVCQAPEAYHGKLLAAVGGINGPDLFLADLGDLGYLAEAGLCEPLDRYLEDMRDLGSIIPFLPKALSVNGKVQGLPVNGHPLALFIRQDWLNKLALKPPATWDEMALAAEAFTKRDPNGNGQNDTFGLAERWTPTDPAVATRFLPWLYQAGGKAVSSQNGKWTPGFGLSPGIKALRFWRSLWDGGCIHPGAPTNDAAQNLALFTSGQAGMIVEDDRAIPAIRQSLGAKAICAPLPRDVRMCTIGDGFCFILAKKSNYKRAAFSFVEWWVSRAAQEKLILGWDGKPGGTGIDAGAFALGPRRDMDAAVLLGEPLYAGFTKSLAYMSPEPYCPNYAAFRLAVARSISAAMGPAKTVEEALAAGMKEAAGVVN